MNIPKPVFQLFETDDAGLALTAVLTGAAVAAVVRKYADPAECAKQAQLLLAAIEEHKSTRDSDVPGGTLGSSLFEFPNNLDDYFTDVRDIMPVISEIEKQTRRSFGGVFKSFEQTKGGRKVAPACRFGDPALAARVLAFPVEGEEVVLIHEDLANVQAMSKQGFEMAATEVVIAQNLYILNNKESGILRIYETRPTPDFRKAVDEKYGTDVSRTGYPYHPDVVEGARYIDIEFEAGDYCAFRSDHLHKVWNRNPDLIEGQMRLSWNGFLAPVVDSTNNREILYWT